MRDTPLGPEDIERLLIAVAEELGDSGPIHEFVMVGGSLLAMHQLREATYDVDSVTRIDQELRAAVARVAAMHDLPYDWLNDRSKAWLPATWNRAECAVILERGRLRVLGMPLRDVWLMKLNASRAIDREDLVRIWPHTGFAHPEEAVTTHWAAYPGDPSDPHLDSYVAAISRASHARAERDAAHGLDP